MHYINPSYGSEHLQSHHMPSLSSPAIVKEKHIENYSYNLNAVLGEGSYSQVFKGIDTTTNTQVAIKVIDRKKVQNPYVFKMIQQETMIMWHLNHVNIVKVYNVVNTINNIYIIQEFCDGGDLSTYLQTTEIPENEVFIILQDIIEALAELKRNGVIHRDVKPANIFLNQGVYKLGDFGFARQLDFSSEPIENFLVGTPLYMSPQCLQRMPYTEKFDIWSLGISLYELIVGDVPYPCETHEELRNDIYNKIIYFPLGFNENLKNFIEKCLIIEENDRMSIEEAVEMSKSWDNGGNQDKALTVSLEIFEGKSDSNSKAETEKVRNEENEQFGSGELSVTRAGTDTTEENRFDFSNFTKISLNSTEKKIESSALPEVKSEIKEFQVPEKSRTHSNSCEEGKKKEKSIDIMIHYSEIFEKHLSHLRFLIVLKNEVKFIMKAINERETIIINLLLHKYLILQSQFFNTMLKEKNNVFKLEKWDEFTKSQEFQNIIFDFQEIYSISLGDYKDMIKNLHEKTYLLQEITNDKKVHEAILGNFEKLTFYEVLFKAVKQLVKGVNHLIYSNLKQKRLFSKGFAKLLKMLVKFHQSISDLVKNKGEVIKNIDDFQDFQNFDFDIKEEYYCSVLRPKIYELNI